MASAHSGDDMGYRATYFDGHPSAQFASAADAFQYMKAPTSGRGYIEIKRDGRWVRVGDYRSLRNTSFTNFFNICDAVRNGSEIDIKWWQPPKDFTTLANERDKEFMRQRSLLAQAQRKLVDAVLEAHASTGGRSDILLKWYKGEIELAGVTNDWLTPHILPDTYVSGEVDLTEVDR